jgi:CHAT domain-containing protein
MRTQFLADKRDVYDLLMEHAAAPQDAFRLMEQSRARNLRDRLHAAPQHDLRTFAKTLPRGNAVLEYWLGKSSAAVLWITSEGTGMKRLALSAEDRAAITALPAMLADPERSDWRLTAQRVADRILNVVPILGRAGVERIKIIPDGDLARIPFEALPTADARLLIQHYAVSYAASAALIRSSTEKRAIRWPWQTTFEAFADPVPGSSESGVDLVAVRDGQRLPSANSEVMTIAKIVGGRSAVYLGADARKTYLERDTPAPVLHFATHAYADPQNPDRSYILLAPSSASQRFDYLFLKEVYSLPLKSVDLATVSACESDAGKLIAGEGVESFTRAFLAAGVRSVVTSLWSVGDRSTAALMVRFYSALADGMSKADALRAAKLDFIRASSASHPAFWAAFIINGDSDSRIPYVVSWLWLLAPAVAAALCAVVVVRTRAGKA